MSSKYRATAAAAMVFLFLLTSPLMGDGGGGGGTVEDGDSNEMLYITIGLIVVVGGLFFLDVVTSSNEETVVADTLSEQIIETGINWDEAFPEDSMLVTVAVSVFPGENGSETAMQLINVMKELADDNITLYNEPLDLGSDSAVHRAKVAHEYFGVDYLVFQVEDQETIRYAIASPNSVLWTSTDQHDSIILLIAEELLQSGIF